MSSPILKLIAQRVALGVVLLLAVSVLIFAGMLLGVALNAMTGLLGRVVPLPQPVRLLLVCLALVRFVPPSSVAPRQKP